MRFLTKFINSALLVLAVQSFASPWDESPFMTQAEKREKAEKERAALEQAAAQGAPTAVRQDALVDPRDKQVYQITEYRGNIWMASNLNFKSPNSFCYENKPQNCQKAGRLYTWKAAKNACPEGWRVPSSSELGNFLVNKVLLDEAPPGGFRKFNGDFYEFGQNAYFWSSEEDSDYSDYAFYWSGTFNHSWAKAGFYKDQAHSLRCIKGEDPNRTKIYRSGSKASAFDRF